MKPQKLSVLTSLLGALLVLTSPVYAASEDVSHEARIRELEATVAELKAMLQEQTVAQEKAVEATEVAAAPSQDHLSTYDKTTIKVGGFVKVDALFSDYSNAPTLGAGEDFFIPASIRTSGKHRDPRFNLHAKETRFWLKSSTPTKRGDVDTYFEIDFLLGQQGDERVGNSYSPRLRHASISWNRWTVGQTWTNLFNTASLPEYLDFLGPVGVAFARQVQLRYTLPTENGNWAFSLENPETTLTPFGGGLRIDADDSLIPDFIARRNWTGDWGKASIAVMAREIKIDRAELQDSKFGGAIALAGRFLVGAQDDIRWQANYGNALGRYMGLNSFNVGALDANNEINLITQYGVLAAYRHVWNNQLHSSFGASFSHADNDTTISGFAVPESYQSAHADLIWSPIERMSLGAEYIWGRRKDESGEDGMLNRVQFSVKYLY